MAIYTLRSFAPSGRILAVNRSADTDEEALSMAREMVAAASAVASFDLWQGERRIQGTELRIGAPGYSHKLPSNFLFPSRRGGWRKPT